MKLGTYTLNTEPVLFTVVSLPFCEIISFAVGFDKFHLFKKKSAVKHKMSNKNKNKWLFL